VVRNQSMQFLLGNRNAEGKVDRTQEFASLPSRQRRCPKILVSTSHHVRWTLFWQHLLRGSLSALAVVAVLMMASAVRAHAQDELDADDMLAPALCRFGVNVANQPVTEFDIASLRIGWYIDYRANASPTHPNGADYVPIIRLAPAESNGRPSYSYFPSGAALDAAIAGNPGADWIIGNEPDRLYYQDELVPQVYAEAYHDMYYLIKSKDPAARIFAGAIVQPTPVRLQYLDMVLNTYADRYGEPMPVDGWAIHNFILNERSCAHYGDAANKPADYAITATQPAYNGGLVCWGADIPPGVPAVEGLIIRIYEPFYNPQTKQYSELPLTADINLFAQQIVRFRQWMHDRGYTNHPLYLSEYGVLLPERFGFTTSIVNKFMTDTFDYLLNTTDIRLGYPADDYRLVQRLSWYSTADPGFNGSLYTSLSNVPTQPPFVLSAMGANYQGYTAPILATTAISLTEFEIIPGSILSTITPATVTLRATVANAGNLVTPTAVTVRFFDPDGVQIGADQSVAVSGCGDTAAATVTWSGVQATDNAKKVRAEMSGGGVPSQSRQATVVIVSQQQFFPRVGRGIP